MKEKVLIIGGTSDLAETIIEKLYSNYDILITYFTNQSKANYLKEKYNIDIFKLDITNNNEIKDLYNYLCTNKIKINTLINCACLCLDDEFEKKNLNDFRRVIDTNLIGPFFVIQILNPIIKDTIINIVSTDGIDTYNPYSIDYSASKAGLINITKNLSLVLNQRIIGLAPNYIDTKSVREMDPIFLKKEMERIGQKELIKKETVANKIIDIINCKSIDSESIIRMD